MTKDMLWAALYGDRHDLDCDPSENVIESHVSKMRRKLKPFGIVVRSQRFVGYSLVDREKFVNTPPPPPRPERNDGRACPCLTSSTRSGTEFPCSKSASANWRMR
ncbi:hypothetical protein FHX11_001575 [Rhizobium sp. BK602]|nr:hypothetical protein [Rhizobium sp. BK602]